jgi:hypothetical protein
MWSFDRTAPAPTIEFAHRQKPQARGFTPAPVAGDPRYLDVFVPLRVRKPLPVETERRAFLLCVRGLWHIQLRVAAVRGSDRGGSRRGDDFAPRLHG